MRLLNFLNEANVANPKTIEDSLIVWLIHDDLYNNKFVEKWATTTFRKYIINDTGTLRKIDREVLQKITNKQHYMEVWMTPEIVAQVKKDLENKRDVYYFDPHANSHNMSNKWRHIMDYFKDAPPTRDIRMSVDQAFKAADKYFEEKNKKANSVFFENEIKIIKKYSDGSYWCEIIGKNEINREGKIMNHCVSGYWEKIESKKIKILSLRTKDNNPHVTIEYKFSQNCFAQCKGNSNQTPKEIYRSKIIDIANKFNINNDYTPSDFQVLGIKKGFVSDKWISKDDIEIKDIKFTHEDENFIINSAEVKKFFQNMGNILAAKSKNGTSTWAIKASIRSKHGHSGVKMTMDEMPGQLVVIENTSINEWVGYYILIYKLYKR